MAGRKRRRLNSLIGTNTKGNRTSTKKSAENGKAAMWSELPIELLELIMKLLSLKDNVRASVICKRWNQAAISVRVAKQAPCLMYFPRSGNLYEFYDPSRRKTYFLELPELYGSRVCYTKDGWLLLYRPRTHRVFFFNPFTREKIKLPRYELTYQIVAFSSAPTSSGCILFTVKHIGPTIVAISTCYPGAAEWTTVNYNNRLPFVSSIWNKVILCNGCFYCLSLTGWMGVFDPTGQKWTVLLVPPPKCPDNYKNLWKGRFMTEHNGEILVIYTSSSENPIIFKLDQENISWIEMHGLDDVAIFASFLSSSARTDVLGLMRNSIYFSKIRFFGKRCISYSVKDSRYYPRKQHHDWGEQDPFQNIWIEPPQDISTLF